MASAAFQLQVRVAHVYQAYEKAGVTRAEADEVARELLGVPTLKAAREGRDVTRVENELRRRARSRAQQAAPTPAGAVNTATGEIGPEPRATERQVEFIADLLADRVRSGEGGGFFATGAFLTGSGTTTRIDMDAIRRLSRTEASQLITSLKGDY